MKAEAIESFKQYLEVSDKDADKLADMFQEPHQAYLIYTFSAICGMLVEFAKYIKDDKCATLSMQLVESVNNMVNIVFDYSNELLRRELEIGDTKIDLISNEEEFPAEN